MKKNGEHFVTCGQMKVLERRADENGLSYYRMMENAGTEAASVIMERAAYWDAVKEDSSRAAQEAPKAAEAMSASGSAKPMKAYVFCGKGNNGGDGFVVARLLCDKGYRVTVILVDGEPKTQDAITNLGLVQVRDIKILDMGANTRALMELDGRPDIIVDAIYGTGFKGKLKSNGLKAAIYINKHSGKDDTGEASGRAMISSLDIPSGMGGDLIDKNDLDENCIKADHTITFHAKKPVHLQKFAEEYCGEVIVADIGIDEEKLWNIKF